MSMPGGWRRAAGAWIERHPLASILATALFLRLLAAVFARGYGMHDDHFAVIEIAQRWLEGSREWLDRGTPHHRNLVYPGLHFALFWLLERVGLIDPQIKMLIVRLLHAGYSLLTVLFGYRLAREMTDERTARKVGWLLAAFWIFPFMSVRNLIEFVCLPQLMIGFYLLYRRGAGGARSFWAGIFLGLALATRFQTLLLAGSVWVLLLLRREWRASLALLLGAFLASFATLGLIDWIVYGKPYATMIHNFTFNTAHRYDYASGPPYRYLATLVGFLLPPMSLCLLYGFVRTWRRHPLIFWPTLVFLAAHSFFPHKQERFLLPILPFLLLLGTIGWSELTAGSAFFRRRPRLSRGLWTVFWVTNTLLLGVTTLTYSKRVRVESLSEIARRGDATGLIVDTGGGDLALPLFYLGRRQIPVFHVDAAEPSDSLRAAITRAGKGRPNYALFLGGRRLEERVDRLRRLEPDLRRVSVIRPSLVDQLLYRLNPRHNVNRTGYLYRISPADPPPQFP